MGSLQASARCVMMSPDVEDTTLSEVEVARTLRAVGCEMLEPTIYPISKIEIEIRDVSLFVLFSIQIPDSRSGI